MSGWNTVQIRYFCKPEMEDNVSEHSDKKQGMMSHLHDDEKYLDVIDDVCSACNGRNHLCAEKIRLIAELEQRL